MALIETFSLTTAQLAYVTRKADAEKAKGDATHSFFQDVLAGYEKHESVTLKQRDAIVRQMEEDKNRPRVNGKPVNNRKVRDGKPVCRNGSCPKLATVVVGEEGYCADCAAEKTAA
jgi:hypothetical protein